jgi:hypothetical protein
VIIYNSLAAEFKAPTRFAIVETSASFARTDFPEKVGRSSGKDIIGKMTFLGTDIHIV